MVGEGEGKLEIEGAGVVVIREKGVGVKEGDVITDIFGAKVGDGVMDGVKAHARPL
jgi:hypothetical protein